MQTDRYTKVVLTLIAIGLLLNAANNLATTPAFAYGEAEVECVNCAYAISTEGRIEARYGGCARQECGGSRCGKLDL